MSELTEKLKAARGKGYYTLLKQILAECGRQIVDDANQMKAQQDGKLTVYNIGCLCLKYDLNFKATVEWLEECRVLKAGAYQRLIDAGVKPTEVFKATRERQAADSPAPDRW